MFSASGYVQEALLTDYVLQCEENDVRKPANERQRVSHASGAGHGAPASERVGESGGAKPPGLSNAGFLIPVTVDDLAANGLLEETPPQTCWKRSIETVTARKDDLVGLAVASDERIEAYLLYIKDGPRAEILSLRSFFDDPSTALGAGAGARLNQLLARLWAQGIRTVLLPKVHPAELSTEFLETLGFRLAGGHRLYAARARSD